MIAINKTRTGQSPLLTKARANLKSGIAGKFSLNFESTEIFLLRIELLIQTYENENESLRAENYGLANCYCGAAKTKHEHTSDIAVNCQEISENNEEIKALKTLKTGIENLMRNTETTDEELANRIREMLGDDQENFVLSGSMDFFMNEDIWKDIISKDAKNISNFEYKVLAEVYLNLDDQGMEDFYNELFFYVKPDKSYGEDTSMKFYTSGEEIVKEENGQFEPDRLKISKIGKAVNTSLGNKYAEIISLGKLANTDKLNDQYEDSIQREAALLGISSLYDVKQDTHGKCVYIKRKENNEMQIHYIPNFSGSNPEWLEVSPLINDGQWGVKFTDDLEKKLDIALPVSTNSDIFIASFISTGIDVVAGVFIPTTAGIVVTVASGAVGFVSDISENEDTIGHKKDILDMNKRSQINLEFKLVGVEVDCSVEINGQLAVKPILVYYPSRSTVDIINEVNNMLITANPNYELITLEDVLLGGDNVAQAIEDYYNAEDGND